MNKLLTHFNSWTYIFMCNRKRISIARQTQYSMAVSALGEANDGMQAKMKVSAVKEKCKVSHITGGLRIWRKWCQCIQVLAVGTHALGETGLSWVLTLFFSLGKPEPPSGGC